MKRKSKSSYNFNRNKDTLSRKRDYINMKICMKTALFLKEEREKKNISRYYLSNKTKISVNVLEALENGWINQFPEKAYLSKMLRILEKELGLDANILDNLIPKGSRKNNSYSITAAFLDANRIYTRSFSFIIYISCIFSSILLLNKYHLFLSKSNVKTISPLSAELSNNSNDIEPINIIKKE